LYHALYPGRAPTGRAGVARGPLLCAPLPPRRARSGLAVHHRSSASARWIAAAETAAPAVANAADRRIWHSFRRRSRSGRLVWQL